MGKHNSSGNPIHRESKREKQQPSFTGLNLGDLLSPTDKLELRTMSEQRRIAKQKQRQIDKAYKQKR